MGWTCVYKYSTAFLWSYLGSINSTETSLETHEDFFCIIYKNGWKKIGFTFLLLNAAQLSSAQMSCQTQPFFRLFLELIFLYLFCSFLFFSFQCAIVQPLWKQWLRLPAAINIRITTEISYKGRVYTVVLVQLVLLLSGFQMLVTERLPPAYSTTSFLWTGFTCWGQCQVLSSIPAIALPPVIIYVRNQWRTNPRLSHCYASKHIMGEKLPKCTATVLIHLKWYKLKFLIMRVMKQLKKQHAHLTWWLAHMPFCVNGMQILWITEVSTQMIVMF